MNAHQYATAYAARGWSCFPCKPGEKVPASAHGFKDATTEPAILAQCIAGTGNNIGLPTGAHFWVLDVDPLKGGEESLEALEAQHGPLPSTLTAQTRHGGCHLFFAPVPGLGCSAEKLGKGLDVRAAGGYVVAAPSLVAPDPGTPPGLPGGYTFTNWDPLSGDAPRIAPAPAWLVDMAMKNQKKPATAATGGETIKRQATPKQLADLREALRFWDPDPRDPWVKAGLALKSIGSDGFPIWDEWSRRSDKYEADEQLRMWNSFDPTELNIETIFYEAKKAGWGGGLGAAAAFGTSTSCDDSWSIPQPIPVTLLPVAPFDPALLPTSIRAWVVDIAERMQCPPDFPAVGALVALSSVIGRKACIAPKRWDSWQVFPNLWGAVVGRPGVKKSPALSEAMKPLDMLEKRAYHQHAEAMRDHEIKVKLGGMGGKTTDAKAKELVNAGKIAEARQLLSAAPDAENIPAPVRRRHKVTDASVEALGEILIENPWGTLAYRDELNGLLRSLDKEGQEGARSFYLQGYDGNQGYTFDRIGRGRGLHIPAVCISMLGGIQPGKLKAYIYDAMTGGTGDDGLLQRFGLLVWPDLGDEVRSVDRLPDALASQAAFNVFQRLDEMSPGACLTSGELAPSVRRFSPEAQEVFTAWLLEFEKGLRTGEHHPAMESHLSKYMKLVPALALVCSLADGESVVSHDSLKRALAWSKYLRGHAERAYGAGTNLATEAAAALLAKIHGGKVADGFKPVDVYSKNWAKLGEPKEVQAAAQMLCDLGHLRMVETRPPGSGRPSITYQINPAALSVT